MTTKPKSPAYQWYPKDILASQRVAEMPADVECWYRRALDFCWLNGSLPNDPKRCAAIIGKGCTEEGAQHVLEMFVISRKDSTRKIHDRLEIERKKQAANRKEKSKAGKKSAEKRKQLKELQEQLEANTRSTDVPTDVPTEGATEFNSSSSSSTSVKDSSNEESKESERTHARTPGRDDFGKPRSETELEALTEKHGFPIAELHKAFPKLRLTKKQQNLIFTSVKPRDSEAWARTLRIYQGNHDPTRGAYLPEKVGTLLVVFEQEKAKLEKSENGSNQTSTRKSSVAERIAGYGKVLDEFPTEAELKRQS